MKRVLTASAIAIALVLAPTVVPAAIATTASASQIVYKCQRYDWFFGWRVRYTYNFSEAKHLMANGWSCVCQLSYP